MRLRSVWISAYKNLKDFTIAFEGEPFIDVFVGKNGSGKSNFLEALIEIFDHIYSNNRGEAGPAFSYKLTYEIDGSEVRLSWQGGRFRIDGVRPRISTGQTPFPEHLLVYYSGQNEQVSRLVRRYEERFRPGLRVAVEPTAPRIIGIGPACKKVLIVALLMLPEDCPARAMLCDKLGIVGASRNLELVLEKPYFVRQADHDPVDPEQLFWGVGGYVRTFLQHLLDGIEGGFTPLGLFDREAGQYRLTVNMDRLRESLGDDSGLALFRSLEALRAMEMLVDIRLPLTLRGWEPSGLDLFSDGQFQSVYLFGIAEIFKSLNCVALLDEPDAFLHPEWQFQFLRQVELISDQAARTNHFLLTSHSASTIARPSEGRLRLFEVGQTGVEANGKERSDLIRSLSAGFIAFSESEAGLSIEVILENTVGPVLFTEGVSDQMILKTAWQKLFGEAKRRFEIVQAFDCAFLRNMMVRGLLQENHPGRAFFALFDFDGAYQDWIQMGGVVESRPELCLTRKRPDLPSYGMLLPVDGKHPFRDQVIRPNGETFKDRARFTIEMLLYDAPGLDVYFQRDEAELGRPWRFTGDKVLFADKVVPHLAPEHFQRFRPIFDFITATMDAASAAEAAPLTS